MRRGLSCEQSLLAFAFEFCAIDVGLNGGDAGLGRIDRCCGLNYSCFRLLNFGFLNRLGRLVLFELSLRTR